MNKDSFNTGLLDFIASSPTPFHAVETMASMLLDAGFTRLEEEQSWDIQGAGRYFVTRNDSAIIAFTMPESFDEKALKGGVRLTGAHTDSPCLRVKPQPDIRKKKYFQLGVEVYGGALLNPWFDRDLSIAGRVDFIKADGSLATALIDLQQPVAIIPSLAIHLDREANQNRTINAQTDIPPLLALGASFEGSFDEFLLAQVKQQSEHSDAKEVLSHELSFYDTQKPAMVGLEQEFVAAARLDNLLSCYVSTCALLEADTSQCNMMVCTDHEEVGSASTSGAQGPFLRSVLERLLASGTTEKHDNSAEITERLIRNSMLLSIDNAHGVHPNFADKHDGNHGPILNEGPVIKINANQRYASNSRSIAYFKSLCQAEDVPVQSFVVRSDMGCGSTIGPITSTNIGVDTIDIGVPTFAMHSIRELAGCDDAHHLYRVVKRFYGASGA
ncbi:MAG: M18 family aminopeptidase [Pseudohongiellaceae bacterium]|nr:M18 family aminopeptidase [Pseudohongiellaceae bacterium]